MFDDEILKEFIDKAAFEKLSDDEKIMYLKSCYDEGARRCHLRKEREEGLAEGERIGMEKGREQGREEGAIAKSVEIARAMMADGMDCNVIARLTGLNVDQIAEVMKLLSNQPKHRHIHRNQHEYADYHQYYQQLGKGEGPQDLSLIIKPMFHTFLFPPLNRT